MSINIALHKFFRDKKNRGARPRQSRWILRVAAPGHPVGFVHPVFRVGWRRGQPSLASSCAIPGSHHPSLENDHPWSLHRSHFPGYITPPNGTFPGGLSRSSRDRFFRNTLRKFSNLNDHPWSPPAYPLHYETGFLSQLQLLPFHSSNGNAVVYLFFRNTKLVFTWCTARQGIMCSRSSASYARMLLHAIFK